MDPTVDASIWVAAADQRDAFHAESRTFLAAVAHEQVQIIVPAFVVAEVACALARKLQSSARGRDLADDVLSPAMVDQRPVDDALYAATAQVSGARLISWDNELIQRAGAITPTAWLDVYP